MADRQQEIEDVDADNLTVDPSGAVGGDDETVAEDFPPDRYQGVNAWGTTDREQSMPEPLDVRVAHEEPDPVVEALDRNAELEARDERAAARRA